MPSTTQDAHLSPALFTFLRSLRHNNDRDWFKQNKQRYIDDVRDPLLGLIADFEKPLSKISQHFIADASTTGGSMFRIHRDTRFSKDKSPYKTHASAQFRHEEGHDAHCPGFYLHLEPKSVFIGAGIWHPDTQTANAIRQHIIDNAAAWKRIIASKPFKDGTFELAGESLKRPPRGVEGIDGLDADDPLMANVKRKDFIIVCTLDEKAACSPRFLQQVTQTCKAAGPFVRFICDSIDVAW